MRTTIRSVAPLALFAVALLALPAAPAEAGHGWALGGSFSVGRVDFDLFFGRGPVDALFFRAARPIAYRGYRCHDRCFIDRGYTYHHARCPLTHAHFRHYGFDPVRFLGPPYFAVPEARHRIGHHYWLDGYRTDRHRHGHRERIGHYRYDYDSDSDRWRHRRHRDWDSDSDRWRHRRHRDWDSDSDFYRDRHRGRGRRR